MTLPAQTSARVLLDEAAIARTLTRIAHEIIEGNPDLERVKEIEARAGKVFVAGESSVSGASLALLLSELGYHTVYSAAGPRIMHLLIEGGVLNRLYLTFVNRLLGGQPFSTILEGPLLEPAVNLKIHHLYFDPHPFEGVGQLFAGYDRP